MRNPFQPMEWVEQMLVARKQLAGAQSDKDKDFYTNRSAGIFCQRREHCLEPVHRPGQSRPAIHVFPHGRRGIKLATDLHG